MGTIGEVATSHRPLCGFPRGKKRAATFIAYGLLPFEGIDNETLPSYVDRREPGPRGAWQSIITSLEI